MPQCPTRTQSAVQLRNGENMRRHNNKKTAFSRISKFYRICAKYILAYTSKQPITQCPEPTVSSSVLTGFFVGGGKKNGQGSPYLTCRMKKTGPTVQLYSVQYSRGSRFSPITNGGRCILFFLRLIFFRCLLTFWAVFSRILVLSFKCVPLR